jgi:hypothetical protein
MNLISCGDSWSAGAELQPGQQPFGELIAQQLGCNNFINQSLDASSISHLIVQLRQAIQQCQEQNLDLSDTVAVFFLTSIDRDLIWSETLPKGTGFAGHYDPPYQQPEEILLNPNDPLHHHWYRTYHSDTLSMFRANTSLLALQQICQHHKIKDFYVWGWQTHQLWPEINMDRFYQKGQARAVDCFTDDKTVPVVEIKKLSPQYFWPNGSHPNQLGHKIIAENLAGWMTKILYN